MYGKEGLSTATPLWNVRKSGGALFCKGHEGTLVAKLAGRALPNGFFLPDACYTAVFIPHTSSMACWTSNEENTFLHGELPAFRALREREGSGHYGKVKHFINGLYTRFTTAFPLKNDETPDSKRKASFFSVGGSTNI